MSTYPKAGSRARGAGSKPAKVAKAQAFTFGAMHRELCRKLFASVRCLPVTLCINHGAAAKADRIETLIGDVYAVNGKTFCLVDVTDVHFTAEGVVVAVERAQR